MPTNHTSSHHVLKQLLQNKSIDELKNNLSQKNYPTKRAATGNNCEAIIERWKMLNLSPEVQNALYNEDTAEQEAYSYRKNIENYIGTVKVPVGLAGPLRVNGLFAQGDYFIPLATTEAALVASYNRGIKLITESGGCTSILFNSYINRCPCFAFHNLIEAGEFLIWINQNFDIIKKQAELTTRYGKLVDLRFLVEGNRVFFSFDYQTGDASGQNMVTIATQAAYDYIKLHSPVKIKYSFIESNMSGDKKAYILAFQNTRGRKVVAEVLINKNLVQEKLHTDVDTMVQFSNTSAIGATLSGVIGVHGHYANALAALYIACGQDAACVAESAMGVTRFEKTSTGDLYASVTLPSIVVGTVGGGTSLPSQNSCLQILNLSGVGQANAFAEVAAGLCLAGEISISAAMCSDTFTQAHQRLARPVAAENS